MQKSVWIFCFILLVSANEGPDQKSMYCAYEDMLIPSHKHEGQAYEMDSFFVQSRNVMTKHSEGHGDIHENNGTIRCRPEKNLYCFAFWKIDPVTDIRIVIKKGCWIMSSAKNVCQDNLCLAHRARLNRPNLNNSHFCCCSGDMCNAGVNVSNIDEPLAETESPDVTSGLHILRDTNYKERTSIIALASVFSVAFLTAVVYLIYRLRLSSRPLPPDNLHWVEAPPTPGFDVEDLKLCDNLTKGRYSEVWKGTLHEQDVAVKMFSPQHRHYYYNERSIYCLPFMDHENLLKFYGADERLSQDGVMQYLIVLSYKPMGTLTGYLKNNHIDWGTLCRMSYSVARGLAHLHTDVKRGDKIKPAIAHRDLNTRNILVRNDLSCIIADFGFCMTTMGSKVIRNGHHENAEQSSLTDVGTIRYMAPEILEGAVNLRDCEASLKQIDIYALGLVLWEIASRCIDLYQGMPMPEYTLPYQVAGGVHPTFDEMQLLVSRNKVRPKFPDVWKDSNQAVRSMKETIEDCWDPDAEARLTALCVEERMAEMTMLWAQDTRHKGVTPTVNPMPTEVGDKADSTVIPTGPLVSTHTSGTQDLSPSEPTDNSTAPLLGRGHGGGSENNNNSRQSWHHDRSVSTSTTETMIISPSDSEPPPKTQNINLAKSNVVVQPHQGRNPTVERNTHKRSDEELTVSGNTLVSSNKITKKETVNDAVQRPTNQNQFSSDDIFDSLADNLETSLVQNDHLSQHRNPPIPYLQNQVHSSEPGQPRARLAPTNVPNGHITTAKTNNNEQKPHKSRFSKLKPRELGLKLSHLAFGKNSSVSKSQQNGGPNQHKRAKGVVNHPVRTSSGPLNAPQEPKQTEVRILNGMAVVRPTSLPVANGNIMSDERDKDNTRAAEQTRVENRLGIAQVGIARLQPSTINGQPAMVRVRSGGSQSRSSSDLSLPSNRATSGKKWEETNLSGSISPSTSSNQEALQNEGGDGVQNLSRHANPNLLNVGNSMTADCDDVTTADKIKRRIKTPVHMKRGRFSLYNDRIMTSQSCEDIGGHGPNEPGPGLQKGSISLHQFGSVEVQPERLVSANV